MAAATPPGASLTDHRAHDVALATRTRFTEAAVNGELVLKPAAEPLGIDVIVDACPARLDGSLENASDRVV